MNPTESAGTLNYATGECKDIALPNHNNSIIYDPTDDRLKENAVIDVATVAKLLRDFADSLDRVIGKEPAGANIVASIVPNMSSNVPSEATDDTSKTTLSKLENKVLRILEKSNGKFVSKYKLEAKVDFADVNSAIRRIRNKTGLQIQAARTVRRVTGELPKTVMGYRLLPSI